MNSHLFSSQETCVTQKYCFITLSRVSEGFYSFGNGKILSRTAVGGTVVETSCNSSHDRGRVCKLCYVLESYATELSSRKKNSTDLFDLPDLLSFQELEKMIIKKLRFSIRRVLNPRPFSKHLKPHLPKTFKQFQFYCANVWAPKPKTQPKENWNSAPRSNIISSRN